MTVAGLAMIHQNGGCSVVRYSGGASVAIGESFSVATGFVSLRHIMCRVINVQGELFALGNDGLYRKLDPTTTAGGWELIAALTACSPPTISGIYLTDDAGVPTLIWCHTDGGGTYTMYKMPVVRPYSVSSATAVSNAMAWVADSAELGGTIYLFGPNSGATYTAHMTATVNVLAGTVSTISPGGFGGAGATRSVGTVDIIKNRAFYTYITGSGGAAHHCKEFPNSLRFSMSFATGSNTTNIHPALFWPDQTSDDFYVFFPSTDVGNNWYCVKYTLDVWTPTDISATVLPPFLRSTIGTNGQCVVMADRLSTPGTTKYVIAFNANGGSAGQTRYFYEWNGPDALMTPHINPSGGDNADAMPGMHHTASGEYQFVPGELDVEILSTDSTFGGNLIEFRAHNDPVVIPHGGTTGSLTEGETLTGAVTGTTATLVRKDPTGLDTTLHVGGVSGAGFNGSEQINGAAGSVTMNGAAFGGTADKRFRIYYFDTAGAMQVGTLIGAATGGTATRVGNEVQNIIADGVTVYTTVWDFGVDGFIMGQQANVVPSVSF